MINDNLLNGTASLLGGQSYTLISHTAFGSTTGTITGQDLVTSGEFDRNALDATTQVIDNQVRYYGRRSSVDANNEFINVIGWHNAATLASTGNLQANWLVASLQHTSDFDVEVQLWVNVERS